MAQVGESLRLALAVAVVKAKRERESEARRWRLRAEALEAELQSLVRFIGTPVLKLLSSEAQKPPSSGHHSSDKPALSASHAPPQPILPDAEPECHPPSALEQLLQHMLAQALEICSTAEAPGLNRTSPPPHHLDIAAQLELQQRSNACQLAPGSSLLLQQRAHALRQLLHGILALGSMQHSVHAAGAATDTQAATPQPIPVTTAQPMQTTRAGSTPPLHAVLDFVLWTLIFLPPSDLRKVYVKHTVDLLTALLLIGSGSAREGAASQAGPGAPRKQELGSKATLGRPSAQQDGRRAEGGGARPSIPPSGVASRPSQDVSCSGSSVLAAVGQLLEVCHSGGTGGGASTGGLCLRRSGEAAALPAWPGCQHPLPEACQALLNEMVASSPPLGQLVMLACSAALQRSTALLASMFSQNEVPWVDRAEPSLGAAAGAGAGQDEGRMDGAAGMGTSQRQQLARVAAAAAGAQEFEASVFLFELLDTCLSKLPAWCKAETQRTGGRDCSQGDQLPHSYLHQSTDQLLEVFALLPSLHHHLPLFCAAALRSLAAMATALQLVAITPEFAACGRRAECLEMCKKVKAALVPRDGNGSRG